MAITLAAILGPPTPCAGAEKSKLAWLIEPPGLLAGKLDQSFGSTGRVRTAHNRGGLDGDDVADMVIDKRGRIIVVGTVDVYGTDRDIGLARYLPSGVLDRSFSDDGRALVYFDLGGDNQDTAYAVSLDQQDRILIAGSAQDANGFHSAVARLKPDGKLDTTFNRRGYRIMAFLGRSSRATDLAVDSKGRVVIVGTEDTPDNLFVVRLLENGTYDRSFFAGRGVNPNVDGEWSSGKRLADGDVGPKLAIDGRDRVLVAGLRQSNQPPWRGLFAAVRIRENGLQDFSFGKDGLATIDFGGNDQVSAVRLDPNERIVLGGRARGDFAVARLTPDGKLDASFGARSKTCCNRIGRTTVAFDRGLYKLDSLADLAIDGMGRVVLVGAVDFSYSRLGVDAPNLIVSDEDFGIVRLTPAGDLDRSFGEYRLAERIGLTTLAFDAAKLVERNTSGPGLDRPKAVAIDAFGQIVVAGDIEVRSRFDTDFAVIRLHSQDAWPPIRVAGPLGSDTFWYHYRPLEHVSE